MAGWTVKFDVSDAHHKDIEPLFEDVTHSLFKRTDDLWQVELFFEEKPDVQEVEDRLVQAFGAAPHLEALALPDCNWLEQTYKNFPPFSLGPFYIYGQHVEESTCPQGQVPLCIDASTAFGTGEHPTTEGCLQALIYLKDRFTPHQCLDMGCGTGILGFAAAKLWKIPTLCIDNDPEATEKAEENKTLNHLEDLVEIRTGEGFAVCKKDEGFDLILSNIVAGPLKEMVLEFKRSLNSNGFVVLSGILDEQADAVVNCYEDQGLTLVHKIRIAGWSTLILTKHVSS